MGQLQKDIDRGATFDVAFDVGMYWRIIYGAFRLIVGLALLRVVGTPAVDVFRKVMRHELLSDPHDIIINTVSPLLIHHGFTITYFLAIYLIFWGLVDIFLSISMLRHKLWAFPVSIVLILVFVLYEIHRYTHTHSLLLLWFMVVDIVVVWLVRKEWHKLRAIQQDATGAAA
jgi:uncharacterized membrane protein